MLFVSAGFVLALGVPFALLLLALVVPQSPTWIVGLATGAAELLELGCIVYGLRMPA